ncbi:MAG TPA: regulatory protein RecX [Mycobacteriales bacterium]
MARRSGMPGHPEDPPGDPESAARALCLRMLTDRPRTRAQLATALDRRGIPAEVVEQVLARFTDMGLVNDEAFARAWVDSRHHGRGLARRALAAELRRRGVDGDTVQAAVDGLDPDQEQQTARALVLRRLPSTRGLTPVARTRRLVGLLARRGYPPSVAFRVVREVLEQEGDSMEPCWPETFEDEPQPDVES